MKKIVLLLSIVFFAATAGTAQNVGINTTGAEPAASAMLDVSAADKGVLLPQVSLTGTGDVTTISSPANSLLLYNTATAGIAPNDVTPGYYYWANSRWNRLGTAAGSVLAFSSGSNLNGASVVSSSPILLGLGSNAVAIIDGAGQSTNPPQAGGFSFVVPFNGIIQNLQVSADALVASSNFINVIGLQYDFTLLVSPSAPNNGIDHPAAGYITSPLSTFVRFGAPNSVIPAGSFRAASNLNTGALLVNAGDRISVRVRTTAGTDFSASNISQLAFSASLMYTPVQ